MTWAMLSDALLAVLMGGGAIYALRRANYVPGVAIALAALVFSQAGIVLALAQGHSLWLAAGVGGVAASASAFARKADARRIMLLGGSLAAVQLVDPMGGLLAAGLVPATLAGTRRLGDARRSAGLILLLLFVPVLTAVALLYLALVDHIVPALLLQEPAIAATPPIDGKLGFGWRLAPALGGMAIVVPSLVALPRRHWQALRPVAQVAVGVAAAVIAAAILGVLREPVAVLAVAAPIEAVALAQWPPHPARERIAAAAAASGTLLSWAVVLFLVPIGLLRG